MTISHAATTYPTVIQASAEAIEAATRYHHPVIRPCGERDFVVAFPGETFAAVDSRLQRLQSAHPNRTSEQVSQTINLLQKLFDLGSTENDVAHNLNGHSLYGYFRRELPNMDVDRDLEVVVATKPAINSLFGYFCSLDADLLKSFVPAVADYLRNRR